MLKLIAVCFIALMVLCVNAQWEPQGTPGELGRSCPHGNCQNSGGKCSTNDDCCCPNVCWVNGECYPKIPEIITQEGLVAVTGEVGEFRRYDSCENNLGRIGESCTSFRDCCIPLNCIDKKCDTKEETIIANIGKLMSGGG